MLIIEEPTVTVKCRSAIKALFLYVNLCLLVSVMLDSNVHLHPYPFLLIKMLTEMSYSQICLPEFS